MAAALLKIANLTVRYPGTAQPALRLPDLTLAPGAVLAVCGPTGCGKTTLKDALLGLLPAGSHRSGDCRLNEQPLPAPDEARAWRQIRGRAITALDQDPVAALNPVLRIGLQFAQLKCSRDRARALLTDLELTDERDWLAAYPHELSGGQAQRVALALALSLSPQLLLVDEPTASLDGKSARQVLEVLLRVAADRQLGVLLISHDRELLEALKLPVCWLGEAPASDQLTPAPALAPQPVLEARNLKLTHRRRGGDEVAALDDVCLTLAAGETLAVVGPSGSGKSSLARVLMGLTAPDQGQVLLDGQVLPPTWTAERRALQLVLQDALGSLNPRRRVGAVLAQALNQAPAQPTDHAESDAVVDLLSRMELDPALVDRYPSQLSGGQRQRVSLARALAANPRVLILDESLSALDIPVRRAITRRLIQLQAQHGISYLLITHDTTRVAEIAHRVLVLDRGRVAACGSPAEILPGLAA